MSHTYVHICIHTHVHTLMYTSCTHMYIHMQLSAVMEPYLGEDGHYLMRPSSTSEGQLTLTVR